LAFAGRSEESFVGQKIELGDKELTLESSLGRSQNGSSEAFKVTAERLGGGIAVLVYQACGSPDIPVASTSTMASRRQ